MFDPTATAAILVCGLMTEVDVANHLPTRGFEIIEEKYRQPCYVHNRTVVLSTPCEAAPANTARPTKRPEHGSMRFPHCNSCNFPFGLCLQVTDVSHNIPRVSLVILSLSLSCNFCPVQDCADDKIMFHDMALDTNARIYVTAMCGRQSLINALVSFPEFLRCMLQSCVTLDAFHSLFTVLLLLLSRSCLTIRSAV